MHYVEANKVRDRLKFLAQYFRAINNFEAAVVVEVAIGEIMQDETFIHDAQPTPVMAIRPGRREYHERRYA